MFWQFSCLLTDQLGFNWNFHSISQYNKGMIKRSRFSEPLPSLILKGEKNITWRVHDDKDLSVGEELSLCRMDYSEFAKAKIIWIKETTFGALTDEDKDGHENFKSLQELYGTYSKYYSMEITPETPLKVIKFGLI